MRTIALLSVINASVLLVITGVSDAAIAPIVGLFGTIIGYIVNRHPSGNKQD
jgi:biopolymer transport protein ExbB/TolQ